jgi:GDP-4-dehydro-6-deoxy-D-mannose reductase
MRAFVTGAAGFAGSHLVDYLKAHTDWQINAFVWDKADMRHLAADNRCTISKGDILDKASLGTVIEKARPDYVFHLAAIASVTHAYEHPGPTVMTNIMGQINLLQALIHLDDAPRTLIVGSADEYGLVEPDDLPISENAPFRPRNPYSVSKITQDMLGYQYWQNYDLPVVRVRPFNHVGPRQRDSFVVAAFAKQVAFAEAGLQDPVIRVGNLEAKRDFSDVRDIVRGYHLAVTLGEAGQVYNMASERCHAIQEILDQLVALSTIPLQVKTDPARLRPSDTPIVLGDCKKFRQLTGWKAEIPLEQSLQDTLAYWRERAKEETGRI